MLLAYQSKFLNMLEAHNNRIKPPATADEQTTRHTHAHTHSLVFLPHRTITIFSDPLGSPFPVVLQL